ncbi:MAG TPA: threonylcarbamoyl-AMP synthase [Marinilabiliales bacterium]|nr:MAG: threonylcarbamoyl-AMP synthase [Bacteroidetes bacterium GWC2_40_13]OFX72521.1 MAG: threonylcarbamoyl-AMP synthase [Bacteroidetes bacterium GWD2_40_43]OFX90605.1 MAG: threonylcarbamoyl-AMP synthase [Bacteroidetes bacterium GWE2_40_63]OFY20917.1 MAG: threonylcarbamoyl-AMP synthase [Bacteroidetes bacterium GWF2_40_13]OFZ23663.1 MAG: threonylcarbamoyl-AMP synthase [Bacteroidetes bacterium RIFOXYC2_FULL_40_12]HAN00698.1 threonylcarbamoyl-AMP synthase [Marinilabiliales bacterium]
MLIKIYPENPNPREVQKVIQILNDGGVIIFPTDTVYGIGCDITKPKAINRVAKIRGINLEKAHFSFIFYDLSHIADYTVHIPNPVFKLMKRNLPGPFTFILEANKNIPKIFKARKSTIGIRVPDNPIIRTIVNQLGNPILTSSIHDEDDIIEYTTDPELIHEKYEHLVDAVIDGGFGDNEPSTVVDCTTEEFEILRQGKGELIL